MRAVIFVAARHRGIVYNRGSCNALLAYRNPPPQYLEKELALFPRWLLWHLAISPRLELLEASATPLG